MSDPPHHHTAPAPNRVCRRLCLSVCLSVSESVYGTDSDEHPFVSYLYGTMGHTYVGGNVRGIQLPQRAFLPPEKVFTPKRSSRTAHITSHHITSPPQRDTRRGRTMCVLCLGLHCTAGVVHRIASQV